VTLAQRLLRLAQRGARRVEGLITSAPERPSEYPALFQEVVALDIPGNAGRITDYVHRKLVDEREACAQIADDQYALSQNPNCAAIAAAIRARP
jgi:hypothetical protein